ncbi:MAG: type IX secretion system membrane protein PorP/SprF [Chlorobi bacterium]|nr:type IX secretion system membrane protein PorP/SprF [Chlorobiota bacterium]
MLKIRNVIFVIICFVAFNNATGQDMNFTQFHTNLLEINPAYAGSALQPRVSINYRNQWPGINAAFVTYSASYDQYLQPIRGNIGVKISDDRQGSGTLNFFSFDVMYSYRVKLGYEFYLTGGLQAGYNQSKLNWGNVVFPDMIDPIQGSVLSTGEGFSDNMQTWYPDFATGLTSYYKEHYFGFSVQHLAKPSISFISKGSARIDRKYTVNYGYTFPVYINGWVKPHYFISPSILFQKQGSFEQILYGTYVDARPLTYGLWIRQSFDILPNSIIFLLGYKKNNIKFSYTYDLTLTKLIGLTFGTHEIAFIYLIPNNKTEQKAYKSKLKSPWF